MDKILNIDNIFLDLDLKNQDEVFEKIAKHCFDNKITTDHKALINGFKARESEGSTGFEDGFAIPHAKIKEANYACVVVIRLKNDIDWNSLDGKPTKVIIALIVPENESDHYLTILSDIATKLMNQKFKDILIKSKDKNKILNAFLIKSEKTKVTKKEKGLNILAITSCVTGIAHTYMAEEKLLQIVPTMGHNIRVETQGSKGVGTPFTQKEIDSADLVILAVDINVDNSRFSGKKIYQTKVARAIKDPKGLVNESIENGWILNSDKNVSLNDFKNNSKQKREGVMQHILAGISYMIPVIVLGGICLAFSLGMAKAIWGPEAGTSGPNGQYPWNPLAIMDKIGGAAFTMMIPILAGFIGNSIAGRAAIAPAMVGAFIGNNAANFMPMPGMDAVSTPTGFIGAIISGILVGYFVKWVNTWKVPKSIAPAMPIFFIPLIAGIGISIIFMYVIGGPIGWVMDKFSNAIENAYSNKKLGVGLGIGLGLLVGAMASFDMGGPINKIAFVTCSALITQGIAQPMGAISAAIPVAPLGMGFATIFFKKFFNEAERGMGVSAVIMGSIGISEGAIPFAIRDPKRAIICNVVGGMVAGAIAGGFMIEDNAAHGGPIVAILGAVPYGEQTAFYFIAAGAGVIVTTTMYGFWLLADAGNPGSLKERHVAYLNEISILKKDSVQEISLKIKEIHSQIKEVKKQNKLDGKNDESKLNSLVKEFENNISKKVTLVRDFANKKLLAKSTYKELKVLESNKIKSEKPKIKEFKQNNKVWYSKTVLDIKNSKLNSFSSKMEEINANKLIKNQLLETKKTYLLNILKDGETRSAEFIKIYNSKI